MDTFIGLIGRIPSNPLWAQMLSEREPVEEELASPDTKTSKKAPRKSARMSSAHTTKLQPKVQA
jgi:hypothetical protein